MAPTLTSNPFLPKPIPHSRLVGLRIPKLTVFAKKSGPFPPFRLSSAGDDQETSPNSSPFRFDFGKIPDVKSLVPLSPTNSASGLSFGRQRRKDPGTVYVAGATGLAGVRIAQTLLREGFSVRAGVPDLAAAQELAVLAAQYKIISNEEAKRFNAVQSTFQDAESIAKAIGNASKVVVTIGPFENGPTEEVTASDALQVIQAAELAGVGHVAIVYDGSASSSTYNVLDGITSFFNTLFSRSQPLTLQEFLQKIIETDISYTLIKTSLTDDFAPESSYNVVVSAEGTTDANDYKVAKSQIAKLVADVFTNTAVAENKVVEVSTDPVATKRTGDELFSVIPEDGRRKAYAESVAKAKAEQEAVEASEKAQQAAKEEEVKKREQQGTKAVNLGKEAEEKAAAAGISVDGLLDKAKGFSSGLSWEKLSSQLNSAVQERTEEVEEPKAKGLSSGLSWETFSSQLKSVVQKASEEEEEEPKVRLATVRGQAKARNLPPQKAVVKSAALKPKPKPKPAEAPKPKAKQTDSKAEVRKVFGGLFQQETIYIDDD
ncbi:PREDICTED: protein plastid transcriptionally active 16, chloroplastic [Ipomoea nil]|uniref:protein plastid transcriptionally active 16, chloroplastic n=1 Tax=Ipomoea nil TaxID=35883 RepID=UPI000900E57E|nr:PREDICTED: protein plastid transcriptionally active 16, chloroplastic [Ipomoea nil]